MSNHDDKAAGKPATPQRNNYFYGKLLDEANLRKEQEYFNQKRWLLNRLGLGSGVMCGLQVVNQDDQVCITPGVAIDALGHEIVVPAATLINPRKITDDNGKPTGAEITETGYLCLVYRECLVEPIPVLVTDCEHPNGALPSMIQESYCFLVKDGAPQALPSIPDEAICKALSEQNAEIKRNKISEALRTRGCEINQQSGVVLATFFLNANGKIEIKDCDARPQVYSNPQLFEMLMCLSQGGGTQGPQGPKGDKGDKGDKGEKGDKGDKGDQGPEGQQGIQGVEGPQGKDGLPGKGLDDTLTKIVDISWPHDDMVAWKDFESWEAFKITFSDDVITKPVNDQSWFLVSYEISCDNYSMNELRAARFLMNVFQQLNPPPDLVFLVFYILYFDFSSFLNNFWPGINSTLVRRMSNGNQAIDLSDSICKWRNITALKKDIAHTLFWMHFFDVVNLKILIRITVNCDFLIDKNGKSVDGNHIGGALKNGLYTGDGIPGGEFESWFELTEFGGLIPSELDDRSPFKFGIKPEKIMSILKKLENHPERHLFEDFLNNVKSIFK